MELEKIYQLMDKFEQGQLTSFSYHDQEFEIKMTKNADGQVETTPATPKAQPQPRPLPAEPAPSEAPVTPTPVSASAPSQPAAPAPKPAVTVDPKQCVTAPVVGIYYQAHSSEEAPYVQVGDHVSVGQQVGLIQAMQMMRPVVAKQAGQVKALLVHNGEEVNFGQPLIQLIPDTPDDI
ncbi:acetyl-CoA carboxylase biotin carboxyl carrier protein [Lactiplantibacillus plajomi]|uniref:Biotin carboxyl carrier protein of acetyl-CoA carboxylase n=1 Tax=Lactiplantibacillus plajomi TaxID=1457217 RepID=A0ABV6K5C8_9LACO|nr:biotin/lipoyl-containing protein [Lactiplantibacillus plajomi]